MAAFTPKEVEAELNRRASAEDRRDHELVSALRRMQVERANAVCLHCGSPFVSYSDDQPLCDVCLGSD